MLVFNSAMPDKVITIGDVTPCLLKAQPLVNAHKKEDNDDSNVQFPSIRRSVFTAPREPGVHNNHNTPFVNKQAAGMTRPSLALHTLINTPVSHIAISSPTGSSKTAHIEPILETTSGPHRRTEFLKHRQRCSDSAIRTTHHRLLLREESREGILHTSDSLIYKNTNDKTTDISYRNIREKSGSTTSTPVQTSGIPTYSDVGDHEVWEHKPTCISDDTYNRCWHWLQKVQSSKGSICFPYVSTLPPVAWSEEK